MMVALLMVSVCFSLVQAVWHADYITRGTMTAWTKRRWALAWSVAIGIPALIAWPWWAAVAAFFSLRGLFSLTFRHSLSELVYWPPGYIGVTAHYDRLLRFVFGASAARAATWTEVALFALGLALWVALK